MVGPTAAPTATPFAPLAKRPKLDEHSPELDDDDRALFGEAPMDLGHDLDGSRPIIKEEPAGAGLRPAVGPSSHAPAEAVPMDLGSPPPPAARPAATPSPRLPLPAAPPAVPLPPWLNEPPPLAVSQPPAAPSRPMPAPADASPPFDTPPRAALSSAPPAGLRAVFAAFDAGVWPPPNARADADGVHARARLSRIIDLTTVGDGFYGCVELAPVEEELSAGGACHDDTWARELLIAPATIERMFGCTAADITEWMADATTRREAKQRIRAASKLLKALTEVVLARAGDGSLRIVAVAAAGIE